MAGACSGWRPVRRRASSRAAARAAQECKYARTCLRNAHAPEIGANLLNLDLFARSRLTQRASSRFASSSERTRSAIRCDVSIGFIVIAALATRRVYRAGVNDA